MVQKLFHVENCICAIFYIVLMAVMAHMQFFNIE